MGESRAVQKIGRVIVSWLIFSFLVGMAYSFSGSTLYGFYFPNIQTYSTFYQYVILLSLNIIAMFLSSVFTWVKPSTVYMIGQLLIAPAIILTAITFLPVINSALGLSIPTPTPNNFLGFWVGFVSPINAFSILLSFLLSKIFGRSKAGKGDGQR